MMISICNGGWHSWIVHDVRDPVDRLSWHVTEFLPKREVLSLTLTDQGWVHNPNVTCSSYPIKFWGLFGMVAPIAHTTHQNF